MNKVPVTPISILYTILSEAARPLEKTEIISGVQHTFQEAELKTLTETTRYERFFFVIDIMHQSIKFSGGIKQWLGYTEEDFNLSYYVSVIHEHHIRALLLLIKAIIERAGSNQPEMGFMKEKYVIEVALRHASGHYLLAKQTISFWDFDKETHLPTAYLNEFTIWKEYDTEKSDGINLRITDSHGVRLRNLEEMLKENIFETLKSEKYFSIQELRILRKYAYNVDITTNEIASAFKISYNTVNIHNRKIIEKFPHIYANEKIKTAKEIARFLRKENFI